MTTPTQDQTEPKPTDKELNFRALENKYQRALEQANAERERIQQELLQYKQQQTSEDDDDDNEPYVDKKKLDKKLAKFGQKAQQETKSEIQKAVQTAIYEERKSNWLKNNPDFYDVLQHAEKFAQSDPELAETILEMPEGFERQKLVYKNIKALGLHKPQVKEPSIQDKVNQNQRGYFYQPTSVGSAPYAGQQSDFSPTGQKDAYAKMQELKARMRI